MAVNVTDADAYISANCIDIEDWVDSDEARKQRILNAAGRTLAARYPQYMIPDSAVYEFANVLATVFNDTNRLAQAGVTMVTINGGATYDFKESLVNGPGSDLSRFIPQSALDLIGAENGVTISKRRVGWTVL